MPWLVWLCWLEYHPINWKIVSLIPSQGTYLGFGFGPRWGAYGRQPIDVSLSLPLSPSPLLQKRSLDEDFKNPIKSVAYTGECLYFF